MTNREIILRDLLTSRSTVSAIAEHTDLPHEVISTILAHEQTAENVETRPLQNLTIWQLTERGRDIANQLPKPALVFTEN